MQSMDVEVSTSIPKDDKVKDNAEFHPFSRMSGA